MDLLDQAHNGIVGSSFSHDTMPGPAAACIPGQKTKADRSAGWRPPTACGVR